ncbi:hypothetical protein ACVINY_004205 [Sinorhizobium meliloti]
MYGRSILSISGPARSTKATPASRAVDVKSSIDRSAMRRFEPGRNAARRHIPDQLRNCRPVSRQVVSLDCRADDLFPLVIHPAALRSTALAIRQRHDRPTGSKQLDKAIRGRSTDFDTGRKQCHICGCHFAKPMLQEFPNPVCASARCIPKGFIDFVAKWLTPCRNIASHRQKTHWQTPSHASSFDGIITTLPLHRNHSLLATPLTSDRVRICLTGPWPSDRGDSHQQS